MYSRDDPESIKTMFDNIADNYDFVNNLISFGAHNRIRKDAINVLPDKPYNRIIDLCTGTGDIAFRLTNRYPEAYILGVDFSSRMLEIARNKMRSQHNKEDQYNIMFEKADVMSMPYDHDTFNLATMFFGLRNLPDVDKAIGGIYEILKTESLLLIVDIVKSEKDDLLVYDYFEKYMPKLASVFSRDKEAYKYLARSMETFPTHDELMRIMQKHKFRIIKRKSYLNGIISLNLGKKYV